MRYLKIEESEVSGLEDKVFLITGASAGICLATARLFLRKGAKAVVIADTESPPEDLDSRVLYIRTDVTMWEDLRLLFATTLEKYGRIDVVFANARIVDRSDYISLREEDGKVLEPDRCSLDVNLSGCLNTVALGLHHMQKQQPHGGSIVMTSSDAGYIGVSSAAYTVAKHGIIGFLRAMKLQLHPHIPIRINVVVPGWTESNITKGMVSEFGRVGLPFQPPSGIGLAAAKLVVDPSYHGHTLFVTGNQYVEMEGPLGDDMARYFGSMNGDEKQFQELLATMKAQREKTQRAPT